MAFTLIEMLLVISIIGVLAGMIIGLAGYAAEKRIRARVTAELHMMLTAIDAYKAQFGTYPPDNQQPVQPLVDRSFPNQLCYELSGTEVATVGNVSTFTSLQHREQLTSAQISSVVGVTGFRNASEDAQAIKNFLTKPPKIEHYSTNGVQKFDVLVASAPGPNDIVQGGARYNPWHYIVTNPTNNPTTFDLWVEIQIGKKTMLISNW
jgi:prepilin-type N-terminal cleavage/methylation domain-containing protein